MSVSQKLLDSRDLPEIFRAICVAQATGILHAERLKYKRSVYFKGGAPIFAASNLSDDKIGKILFNQGKVTMDQLIAALDVAKAAKKRLGAVLVDQGFISAKDLFEAVVTQVTQIIFTLFDPDWREARFAFEARSAFGDDIIQLRLNPVEILLQGVRKTYRSELVQATVGPASAVFSPAPSHSFDLERLALTVEEKKALLLIDGNNSIEQITRLSGVGPAAIYSLFYVLKGLGCIELRSTSVEPTHADSVGATTKERSRAEAYFAEGQRHFEAGDYAAAEIAFRQAIAADDAKPTYYWGLGFALAAAEKGAPYYEEAVAAFSRALELEPTRPRGYYYLGTVLRHRGETAKAAEHFRKALQLDTRYEPARVGLAQCGAN